MSGKAAHVVSSDLRDGFVHLLLSIDVYARDRDYRLQRREQPSSAQRDSVSIAVASSEKTNRSRTHRFTFPLLESRASWSPRSKQAR